MLAVNQNCGWADVRSKAGWKGWLRNAGGLRARVTTRLSALIVCNDSIDYKTVHMVDQLSGRHVQGIGASRDNMNSISDGIRKSVGGHLGSLSVDYPGKLSNWGFYCLFIFYTA